MTWANRITILRILLIPVFVTLMIHYGKSIILKDPNEWFWAWACMVFALAAVSDGVDGYLARHRGQRTELGAVLDPLADKLLLVTAIVLLTVNYGDAFDGLPPWFAVTVFARDLFLGIGAMMVHLWVGEVNVRPRWVGKVSTVAQMLVIGWTLLKIHKPDILFSGVLFVAATSTIASCLWYIYDGVKQLGAVAKASASRNDQTPNPKSQ